MVERLLIKFEFEKVIDNSDCSDETAIKDYIFYNLDDLIKSELINIKKAYVCDLCISCNAYQSSPSSLSPSSLNKYNQEIQDKQENAERYFPIFKDDIDLYKYSVYNPIDLCIDCSAQMGCLYCMFDLLLKCNKTALTNALSKLKIEEMDLHNAEMEDCSEHERYLKLLPFN